MHGWGGGAGSANGSVEPTGRKPAAFSGGDSTFELALALRGTGAYATSLPLSHEAGSNPDESLERDPDPDVLGPSNGAALR